MRTILAKATGEFGRDLGAPSAGPKSVTRDRTKKLPPECEGDDSESASDPPIAEDEEDEAEAVLAKMQALFGKKPTQKEASSSKDKPASSDESETEAKKKTRKSKTIEKPGEDDLDFKELMKLLALREVRRMGKSGGRSDSDDEGSGKRNVIARAFRDYSKLVEERKENPRTIITNLVKQRKFELGIKPGEMSNRRGRWRQQDFSHNQGANKDKV